MRRFPLILPSRADSIFGRDNLIRDRVACYGNLFVRRVRSLGIRDRPTSPRSPWQNGYAERLIGSIRRECLDHVVVFGERHLRHLLLSYMDYYNTVRTHLSLAKDSPAGAPSTQSDASKPGLSSAACIIIMSGFDIW
jgi:transposase InsO family protein